MAVDFLHQIHSLDRCGGFWVRDSDIKNPTISSGCVHLLENIDIPWLTYNGVTAAQTHWKLKT